MSVPAHADLDDRDNVAWASHRGRAQVRKFQRVRRVVRVLCAVGLILGLWLVHMSDVRLPAWVQESTFVRGEIVLVDAAGKNDRGKTTIEVTRDGQVERVTDLVGYGRRGDDAWVVIDPSGRLVGLGDVSTEATNDRHLGGWVLIALSVVFLWCTRGRLSDRIETTMRTSTWRPARLVAIPSGIAPPGRMLLSRMLPLGESRPFAITVFQHHRGGWVSRVPAIGRSTVSSRAR